MKTKSILGVILIVIIIGTVWMVSQKTKNPVVDSIVGDQGQKVYHLKFGHDMPENSAQHISAVKFADIVNYKSKGSIKIKIFPNQELGTDQLMIEMARVGELAIILPPSAKMSTLVPEMQLLDLPFLFPSREELYEMLDGKPGQMLLDKLKPHGLIGVAVWESGFKQFTANKEIHTPKDFKNLNIRTMKSQTIMEQFKAFGANPIPIDFQETYQALKDGVVDGQENPLASIVGMKFHEVQSHVIISNHAYLAQVIVFSRKIFESLPRDIQEILYSTAREIAPFERNEVMAKEIEFIKTIQASGTYVYTLTPEERRSFHEASKNVVEHFRPLGSELLSMVEQLMKQKQQEVENEIIIGLNADLVAGSALSGQAIKRGMELAITEINQKGGVLGKQIKIISRNNSGISAHGIDNMKYFSKLNNLVAVMCGIYSPIALAELEIIHKEKLLFLDPWAAATSIVDNGYKPNYVFRVSVRDEFAGPFLVAEALKRHTKIALLLVNDGWGKGNLAGITKALAKKNLAPVAVEWFNWGQQDMTSQLERIEKKNADVILLVAGASEGITIIKNMADRSKKTPFISHWGITGGHFWKAVNRELEQVSLRFLQSFSFMNATKKIQQNLIENYFKAYNINHPGEIFAPVGTAHAYDLVHLLAMAIKKAGNMDRPAIRDALEQIKAYQGVVKHYAPPFTPLRHDALDQSSFFLAKYDRNGYIIPD